MTERATFSLGAGEASGAVADLGVFAPLAVALIVVNGLSAGSVLLAAGGLLIATGLVFRVPFPVQPLKALTAVAVAQQLAPGVINAAGLEIAAVLLLLSIGHVADRVSKVFTQPVVRALQLGVGLLLALSAYRLVSDPPAAFAAGVPRPWLLALGACALAVVAWEAHRKRYGIALAGLVIGVIVTALATAPSLSGPSFELPTFAIPQLGDFSTAFWLLVIPQIPLTFGNAVVAVTALEHEYFGARARRVTPTAVCLSCGVGNIVSALIGGMPMCHGAGGLTAHYRLGARTAAMNLLLGTIFVVLGLFFAAQFVTFIGLLPVWILAGFLAYAGIRHALLAFDQQGWTLAMVVVTGGIGAWMSNLAITTVLALLWVHAPRILRRGRTRED